jgi:hypothetical protein
MDIVMFLLLALIIELVFILFILIPVMIFVFCRNRWVCVECIRLAWVDHHSFDLLPSYSYMVRHFWVWDIKKFIKEKK